MLLCWQIETLKVFEAGMASMRELLDKESVWTTTSRRKTCTGTCICIPLNVQENRARAEESWDDLKTLLTTYATSPASSSDQSTGVLVLDSRGWVAGLASRGSCLTRWSTASLVENISTPLEIMLKAGTHLIN